MHLTYRAANVADIEACVALMPTAFGQLAPDALARLPGRWRRWLRERAMLITVVEDTARPQGARIVAFGTSVFVTDAFAEAVRVTLPPPIGRHLSTSALLGPAAIREANSGVGLILLLPFVGWDNARLSAEDISWVKRKLIEAFFFTHAGFRIKEVLQEIYTVEDLESLSVNLQLISDYSNRWTKPATLAPECRPFLIGVTRETCREGSQISPLFFYQPPRFGFRPGEQDILRLALMDKSDEQIAAELAVSPATVHKRWQSIHETVASCAPGWFPHPLEETPRVRGTEKRRSLLSYLRSHPEELRPFNLPAY